jgi:hypothetical protein
MITTNKHKPRRWSWGSLVIVLTAAALLVGGMQAMAPAPAQAFNEECIDNPLLCETGGGGGGSGGGGGGSISCEYWFWRWYMETNADAANQWWNTWVACLANGH